MTAQEIDRIECAIRHIQTATDIDPWAVEIAVEAMKKQIPQEHSKNSTKLDKKNGDLQPTCNELAKDTNVPCKDTISRKDAIDAPFKKFDMSTGVTWIPLEYIEQLPSAQPEPQWIPCKERLPEEDHWLGGSGKQFSDEVLISITNREDADAWSDISQTIDGEWGLELPRHCKITAWKPLPEPYREEDTDE
ncbi:MAG: DUF551 domain-containing protein [Oscillospiraceae bacterium]|nr:DUF551 domain-containing protein [Oscillospiraceae bacterium]